MDRIAAAYIRRSSADAKNPGEFSREAQLAAVRGLCGEDVRVFEDWGISGSGAKTEKRVQYARLLEEIDAGRVASVCALSITRLGRNTRELLAFFEMCRDRGVVVSTKKEGTVDTSNAMGRFFLQIMAAVSELELEMGKERSADALDARVARGDHMGRPAYGYRHERGADGVLRMVRDESVDLSALMAAYEDAGTILGACRLLEARGIPAPFGGERWATSALTRIIEREWPEKLPQRRESGKRTRASAMFSGLLRCPFCDRMLTPNVLRGQYYCANGARERATHPRYAVREQDVMPWIVDEADHLDIPADAVALEGIEERQDAIHERVRRFARIYAEGNLTDEEYDAEKARAARDLEALAGEAAVADIAPVIDWDNPPDVVNRALRAIWRSVELGPDLLPVSADWIVKEWRRA